jgi:hypothetical protein
MSFPKLTCRACGHEGHDVQPRVVEQPDGKYAVESRCIDHEACEDRAACDYCVDGIPVSAGFHYIEDPEGVEGTAKIPCARVAA